MKTAEAISREIFYMQATNGKAEGNIKLGAEMIMDFAKRYANPTVEQQIEAIREVGKEACKTPESARQYLVDAGIIEKQSLPGEGVEQAAYEHSVDVYPVYPVTLRKKVLEYVEDLRQAFVAGAAWQAGQGMRWVKAEEIIKAQEAYIDFLGNESAKYIQFAGIHGMKVPDEVFKEGQRHRDNISLLKLEFGVLDESSGGGMAEALEEENNNLREALKYLMEGVSGLPPLTAIEGTLIKHFEKAESALSGGSDGVEKKD